MITLASIVSDLNTNDGLVGRAMVRLLSQQTIGERSIGQTVESNGKGFDCMRRARGTYFAHWVLGLQSPTPSQEAAAIVAFLASKSYGRPLTGKFLKEARALAIRHRKQLLDMAIEKEAALSEAEPPTVRNPRNPVPNIFEEEFPYLVGNVG